EVLHGLAGKTPGELLAGFSRLELVEPVNPGGWWNAPVEPDEAVMPRAQRVVKWLYEKHGNCDDQIVLFSHGGFFAYFLAALIGRCELLPAWFVLNNTGRCCFEINPRGCVIRYLNRLDHLNEAQVS
ncbi:MAG: histidine phosphatase family protein, partial [Chloroflexota bacterium]